MTRPSTSRDDPSRTVTRRADLSWRPFIASLSFTPPFMPPEAETILSGTESLAASYGDNRPAAARRRSGSTGETAGHKDRGGYRIHRPAPLATEDPGTRDVGQERPAV